MTNIKDLKAKIQLLYSPLDFQEKGILRMQPPSRYVRPNDWAQVWWGKVIKCIESHDTEFVDDPTNAGTWTLSSSVAKEWDLAHNSCSSVLGQLWRSEMTSCQKCIDEVQTWWDKCMSICLCCTSCQAWSNMGPVLCKWKLRIQVVLAIWGIIIRMLFIVTLTSCASSADSLVTPEVFNEIPCSSLSWFLFLKTMRSVLKAFNLWKFYDIQVLTLSRAYSMHSSSRVQTAQSCMGVISIHVKTNILTSKGAAHIITSTGPRTDPWHTPQVKVLGFEEDYSMIMRSDQPVMYDCSHASTAPEMPKQFSQCLIRSWWSMVSNAA